MTPVCHRHHSSGGMECDLEISASGVSGTKQAHAAQYLGFTSALTWGSKFYMQNLRPYHMVRRRFNC